MTLIEKISQAVSEALESALGVTLTDMLVQLAATIILIVIVKVFFWGKITAFIEKRRDYMAAELEAAETAKAEAETLKEKTEADYTELRQKAKDVIESAKKKGESERQTLIAKGKEEARATLAEAERELASVSEKTRDKIRDEAVDLAALMAEKIINQEIDRKKLEKMVVEDIEGGNA
ncbi:MAG: F0F1 ATP synthase subunit B [Candidatus Izemoplasmatales bacterium]|nr:F0F1 ATP synthase subunit B [Candidatus Izemoplasmatales bacterium]